jgi:hypothetical protein
LIPSAPMAMHPMAQMAPMTVAIGHHWCHLNGANG